MVGGCGDGEQEAGPGLGGQRRVDAGRRSVLQHRLVVLENTLVNFWSSALQRDLRKRRVQHEITVQIKRGLNGTQRSTSNESQNNTTS